MCNLANKKTMKRIIIIIMALTTISGLSTFGQTDPSKWSSEQLKTWFEKGDWHKAWTISAEVSTNKAALAKAYYKNPERWNKAFAFLKDNDLKKLELKRFDLDGDNLFITISEYNTKNPESAKYEAHRKYIDIQYVVTGNELIGIAPFASKESVLQEYNPAKDIEFVSVKGTMHKANPSTFFIFFPEDAHMPGLKDGANAPVRKAVVKIMID
jgi:YhcH/YjgK/YiaL family protein